MSGGLPVSTQRVQAALDAHGLTAEVREFPASTRTSAAAAAAIGCTVGQIAKSLDFRLRPAERVALTGGEVADIRQAN